MTPMTLLLFVSGLCLLVAGAEALVRGASRLATAFGISPLVVGLTVVAYGTSAPEMAVSISSAMAGNSGADLAFGNVVGSNIFNILAVLGFSGLIAPEPGIAVAPGTLAVDLPFMIAVAAACLPIFFTGHTIARWEGVVFLAYYLAYTFYLFLNATENAALQSFTSAMFFFVVPLTALTLVVSLGRELHARRQSARK